MDSPQDELSRKRKSVKSACSPWRNNLLGRINCFQILFTNEAFKKLLKSQKSSFLIFFIPKLTFPYLNNGLSNARCYVGVEKEQWRSCSVSYVPLYSPQGAYSSNSYAATRYPNKKHDFFQSPPRPGGLHSRDLMPAASHHRLLPVIYLHNEGPPNSTQISNNVIDCNREKC